MHTAPKPYTDKGCRGWFVVLSECLHFADFLDTSPPNSLSVQWSERSLGLPCLCQDRRCRKLAYSRQPGTVLSAGVYSAIPATSLSSVIERESTMGSNIDTPQWSAVLG